MPDRTPHPRPSRPARQPRSIDAEEVIVAGARLGDLRAWDLVVRRHQEAAFRVVYLLTGDAMSATEATRATFLRAYRALPELPAGTPVRPWLLLTAAQVARAQRRLLDRIDEDASRASELPSGPRLPATPVIGRDQAASLHPDVRDQLRSGFGRLTSDERLAMAARYLAVLNRSEAAKLIASDVDGVDRALHAAISNLRSSLPGAWLVMMPPDQLGWLTIASMLERLPWIPDVAPDVAERLMRDAVTYPEIFGPSRRLQQIGGLTAIPVEAPARATPTSRR